MKTYNYIVKEIKDKDYYFMIENKITDVMPKYEVAIALPKAEKLLEDCKINKKELKDYPIEGYYYKNEALKKYFTIIRNLQHNISIFHKIKDIEELEFLQKLTVSEVWGVLKNNTVNETMVWRQSVMGGLPYFVPKKGPYNEENPPLIRKYDILTLTMEDKELFNQNSTKPWTVETIKNGLSKYYKNRPNLVELGYLTGETECLLCGAETNSSYRIYAMITGYLCMEEIYQWKVSEEVEKLGRKIIDEYNKLIGSNIEYPTIFNHFSFKKDSEKPRVAFLGKILFTNNNYFWILDKTGRIYDQYTTEFLTTEKLLNT